MSTSSRPTKPYAHSLPRDFAENPRHGQTFGPVRYCGLCKKSVGLKGWDAHLVGNKHKSLQEAKVVAAKQHNSAPAPVPGPSTAPASASVGMSAKADDGDVVDEIRKRSNHLLRLVELDPDIDSLLLAGRRQVLGLHDTPSSIKLDDREQESLRLLLELIPPLQEYLKTASTDAISELATSMRTTAMVSRGSDIMKLKESLLTILEVDEEDDNEAIKACKGLCSDIFGKFICPVNQDWEDADTRKLLRSGEIALTSGQFNNGLYLDCESDPDNLDFGLLRNKALISTYKLLYTGRKSALNQKTSRKRTNANITGMSAVTPRSIAYAATLFWFCCSNWTRWTLEQGEFNLERYYWLIVDIFDGSQESDKIIDYWNQEIFGNEKPKKKRQASPSALDRLREQRRNKKRSRPASIDIF